MKKKWFIDKNAYVIYIQHQNNELGANNNIKGFLKRVKMILSKEYFKQSVFIAKCLDLHDQTFVKRYYLLDRKSFLYLAYSAIKCRRKALDKFIFFIFCLMLVFVN